MLCKIKYANIFIVLLSMIALTLIFGNGQQKLVAIHGDVTTVAMKVPHST
jgi:hypothetical protein